MPEIFEAILAKDPEALFLGDVPPAAEQDRAKLVRQILHCYDTKSLFDERIVRAARARLDYRGLAADLKPYISLTNQTVYLSLNDRGIDFPDCRHNIAGIAACELGVNRDSSKAVEDVDGPRAAGGAVFHRLAPLAGK